MFSYYTLQRANNKGAKSCLLLSCFHAKKRQIFSGRGLIVFETRNKIFNNMVCATSKASDQSDQSFRESFNP